MPFICGRVRDAHRTNEQKQSFKHVFTIFLKLLLWEQKKNSYLMVFLEMQSSYMKAEHV